MMPFKKHHFLPFYKHQTEMAKFINKPVRPKSKDLPAVQPNFKNEA